MDSATIRVQDYDIVIKSGALKNVGELLNLKRKVLIVTDSGVPSEYAQIVASQAKEAVIHTIPMGEQSKSMDSFKELISELLANSFTRGDCVVAVGGGVVGDLSGFAASCYMRGIDFYNIPTTLLSCVDSSIGGKTAVDFDGVKNIVGAFYTPKKVIIDTDTLKTLEERQLAAGFAECIKMAACFDKELFEKFESANALKDILSEAIIGSLKIKKAVVEEDFKETGLRAVLNFGHTLGHAVEAKANGELLHGECVAIGMVLMARNEAKTRIKNLLERYGLPTKSLYKKEELLPYVVHDKKKSGSKIKAVTVDKIGSYNFEMLSENEISAFLEDTE